MGPSRVRLAVADDHGIIRDCIQASLTEYPELEIVAVVADGVEAVKVASEQRPDVMLMDVTMPGMNGIEATRRITALVPAVKVVCISMHSNLNFVTSALEAGASGYLLKESAIEEVVKAIHCVMADRIYLNPSLAVALKATPKAASSRPGDPFVSLLTNREREVLQLIAEGYSTKRIASRLGVSVKTVSTHRQHMMDKLEIRNVAGVTRFAIAQGLIGVDRD